MIAYFDTSAIVPLLVDEPGSDDCRRLWTEAEVVVSCELAYVETAAAVARARRLGRLSVPSQSKALKGLEVLWSQLRVIGVDHALVRSAALLADRHGLRGYDAVHCAAGQLLISEDTVAASGERELLAAWNAVGLITYDVSADTPRVGELPSPPGS